MDSESTASTSQQPSGGARNSDLIVFQCSGCNAIIGDSSSYIGTHRDIGIMVLAAANNVYQGNNLVSSTDGEDVGSTYVRARCLKCKRILGQVYKTTPKELDFLRETFSFDVFKVTNYELASGKVTPLPDKPVDNSPVPSYRDVVMEFQKMQGIFVAMNERINTLEKGLPPASRPPADNTVVVLPQVPGPSSGPVQPITKKQRSEKYIGYQVSEQE
ncbi:protein Mis18-alpha-like [Lingula anatina]|uniref:Protein Mis18-alpha-like n=1 Tax=Lingula anatina TaxID=7574 RepID=A0A1S3HU10_LINAN|nr:protein Mis18-alpha-like [Lingula anatina]|eukprot:XP_013389527.1 protein Mis18-alpha-like [Lingula anatina]